MIHAHTALCSALTRYISSKKSCEHFSFHLFLVLYFLILVSLCVWERYYNGNYPQRAWRDNYSDQHIFFPSVFVLSLFFLFLCTSSSLDQQGWVFLCLYLLPHWGYSLFNSVKKEEDKIIHCRKSSRITIKMMKQLISAWIQWYEMQMTHMWNQ